MSAPLEGIRVLELTTMITGPLAGMMLADLGADNIKIENPDGGDLFRTFRGGNYSPYFCAYNRNKRSIAVDLQSATGHAMLIDLVKTADVLIENFRPGVMDRLDLSFEKLIEVNPGLIYCSITGFGPDGPYKDRPSYDAVSQALSGMSSLFIDDSAKITGPTITDNMTGIFACYGILGALVERAQTGRGRKVETNMLSAAVAFIPDPFLMMSMLGMEVGALTRVQASQSYVLRCEEGKLVAVHLSSQIKFWEAIQKALGREDLGQDQRFKDRSGRIDNYLALAAEFNATTATRPSHHWMAQFQAHDIPHAPVNSLAEAMADPQVRHLDTFRELKPAKRDGFATIRRPVWFDGSREDQPFQPPPELDEHAVEILSELGWDGEKIAAWTQQERRKVKDRT